MGGPSDVGGSAGSTLLADPAAPVVDDDESREFADLLDARDVRVVFQPLVDLRSGEIVALEALARGPHSSRFASPLALFSAARKAGRVAELDWVCRAVAFETFLNAGLPPAMSLFVNSEPESLAVDCPPDLTRFVTKAESMLRVFVEVNDRALAADPAGVFAAITRAREMGWGIAIDDVGGSRAPIAMLPVVRADVVKLDLRLLRRTASEVDSSAIVSSVLRHVEMSGAVLLVEGIENKEEARWAHALGARYGQGMHLGAPGGLAERYPVPSAPVRLINAAAADVEITSPFEMFGDRDHQRMDRALLERMADIVANSPRSPDSWPVFLTGVGRDQVPAEAEDGSFRGLTLESLLFVAFGTDMPGEPALGVRGVRIPNDDPLADERFLIVLGDQGPAALFARLSRDGTYDVVMTQNPDLVHGIVRHLIRRVPRPGTDNRALPTVSRKPAPATAVTATAAAPAKQGWRARRNT